jgi:hypothetical protein
MNPIVGIFLGHLLGDYIFQNNWMALTKNRNTFRCLVHCLVYTASVCMLTTWSHPWWPTIVFLSHFPIDRFGLAERWLKLIGGRSMEEFIRSGHLDVPEGLVERQHENYVIARGGFTALVFAVVDNTMHLLLMVLGWRLLFG